MTQARPVLPCGCPASMADARHAGAFSVRYSRYLPCCAAGRHVHGEARIALPLHGFFETACAGHLVQVKPGGDLYRPANGEHGDVYRDVMDCVNGLYLLSSGTAGWGQVTPNRCDACSEGPGASLICTM